MYQIVSLSDLKSWLKITDTSQDTFFAVLQESITGIVEDYIKKVGITRHFSNEFQNGGAKESLMTKQYPIYKVVAIYDDTEHDYGSDTLIASGDYVINYDTGKIQLTEDVATFYDSQNNVKIDYWAGLSRFLVVDEQNNYLDVTDTGGTVAIEIDEKAAWGYDGYNAEDLATEIAAKLNANGTLNGTYTVTYSHVTQKFTIACDETFSLLWNSGDSSAKDIGDLIGFDTSADDTAAQTYTADNARTGIDKAITMACMQICYLLWDQSKQGASLQNIKKRVLASGGGGTYEYLIDQLPPIAKSILDKNKRVFL